MLRSVDAQSVNAARRSIIDAERRQQAMTSTEELMTRAREVIAEHTDDTSARISLANLAERLCVLLRSGQNPQSSYGTGRAHWRGLSLDVAPEGGWWSGRKSSKYLSVKVLLDYRTVDELSIPINRLRGRVQTAQKNLDALMATWLDNLARKVESVRAAAKAAAAHAAEADRVVSGYVFAHADELAEAEAKLRVIEAAIEEAANPTPPSDQSQAA